MTQSNETVVVDPTPETKPRFNFRKYAKYVAIALTAGAVLVVLKRKTNASVDGEVTATVGTNDES